MPVLSDLSVHLDEVLARRVYRALSIDVNRELSRLRAAGKAFRTTDGPAPTEAELEQTTTWVIDQASRRRAWSNRVVGVVGVASIPSEVLYRSMGLVRLAQRLALVRGFDLSSDRGTTALLHALSAGLQIELPDGPLRARASDLASTQRRTVGGTLVRALVGRASADTTHDVRRLVPLLGARVSLDGTREAGERMAHVLARLAEPTFSTAYTDVEVVGTDANTADSLSSVKGFPSTASKS